MNDDKRARQLARIELMRRHTEARLERQRARIDQRFDRMRQRIAPHGTPSDNQQRIIQAALELLDEVGLANLTLRKLAAKLDLQAPALYWHFKNKEVLIDYMAEAILDAEFKDLAPRQDDEAWQDWLVATCQHLRSAMLGRRDGARIVAGAHLFPAITLMKLFEISMQSLTSAGVELQRANLIIGTAVHFVFGNAIEEQSSPSLDEIERFKDGMLADFPLMHESITQTIKAAMSGHDEFEDSLRLIIGKSQK